MPTDPATAYFLGERERRIAAERLMREHKAVPDEQVTLTDVRRSVTSWTERGESRASLVKSAEVISEKRSKRRESIIHSSQSINPVSDVT